MDWRQCQVQTLAAVVELGEPGTCAVKVRLTSKRSSRRQHSRLAMRLRELIAVGRWSRRLVVSEDVVQFIQVRIIISLLLQALVDG